jgi:hypothetical protein
MEAASLFVGIMLMLVAATGIVLYVALVIAIPVCRLLDWLFGEEADERTSRRLVVPTPRSGLMRLIGRVAGRTAPPRQPEGKDA